MWRNKYGTKVHSAGQYTITQSSKPPKAPLSLKVLFWIAPILIDQNIYTEKVDLCLIFIQEL